MKYKLSIKEEESDIQQYNKDDIQFQIEDKLESLSDFLGQQLIALDINENQLFTMLFMVLI